MRIWGVIFCAFTGFSAAAESLRCVSEVSERYRFGFEAKPYSANGPIQARVIAPGLFGVQGQNTGRLNLALINRSKHGFADYDGTISDYSKSYAASMWMNTDRQDQTGRFRARITIQMRSTIELNLICRINP